MISRFSPQITTGLIRERIDFAAAAAAAAIRRLEFYRVVHAHAHACIINRHGEIRQRASARV